VAYGQEEIPNHPEGLQRRKKRDPVPAGPTIHERAAQEAGQMKSTKNPPKNVAIYVRISRDDGMENYESLETQKSLLLDFVRKNSLGTIAGIYEDDNISGSSFDRPGLESLKRDIDAGLIDLLVIKDLSRLGRNNAKTLTFLDYLEEKGVDLITSDGRYQSLRDNDIVGIESWLNERYIKDLSVKIRQTLRHKIQRGEYIGNAPYGYMKNPAGSNSLIINPDEAPIVKNIFQLYTEGQSLRAIAQHLNSLGIPSPGSRKKPGSRWNPSTIMRILSNRVYLGDTIQGVSEKISYKSRKTRRLPPSQWVLTPNTHEPIVDRDLFEKAARLRQQRRSGAGNHKGRLHLFKGLLFCGDCGSPMYARMRRDRPMAYCCSNYMKNGSSACSSHHVRESDLLKQVLQLVLDMLEDEEAVKGAVEMLEGDALFTYSPVKYRERLLSLEKKLEGLFKQQEILYFDKLEGRVSYEFFDRIWKHIDDRIKKCKEDIAEIKRNLSEEAIADKKYWRRVIDAFKIDVTNSLCDINSEVMKQFIFIKKLVELLIEKIDIL